MAAVAGRIARRDAGLDALRASLTILVVFHHAALTYGAVGGWYYREVPLDGRLETKLLILFVTVDQAFFMGLFFLIAGSLTPAAIRRHGLAAYARDRLLRLGVPLLAYLLVISPLTIGLAQVAYGRPFGATVRHVVAAGLVETGPLWFNLALILFGASALAWTRMAGRRAHHPWPFPSNPVLLMAALGTGLAAFVLRLAWPVGWQVAGLQLGYFPGYVVLFAAGCAGASAGWLQAIPDRQRRTWVAVACLALPLFPAALLLQPLVPALRGDAAGGWNLPAALYAFWEPLLAWGFALGLVHACQRRFVTLGPAWQALVRRAYAIFIVHPPVLVAIAIAWRGVPAPHALKFAVTGSLACLACFWLAGLALRIPGVRRIV